ncbi:MAG: aspartate 1-decarboxylase [Spiribacter sp.]|jgi:aspartate 1-decarboxylase|nr:aspartate 1-decarboxylase [Spiribacter sp.]MDR9489755.1 aspartate 1-decarboxylase [Spiribacter sp.]
MNISVLQAKIHRATVTDANLDYEGSITIDAALLQASGLLPFQQVHVYNISNGHRFETYIMEGPYNAGDITINGAAAHLARPGDKVIIAAYALLTPEQAKDWQPKLIFVNEQNQRKSI